MTMIPKLCLFTLLVINCSAARAGDFESWVKAFRVEALQRGVTPATFDKEFQNLVPNPRVIELDGKQPERTQTGFATYLSKVLSQGRIDNGRASFSQNMTLLKKASAFYGVPPEMIVSLWGVETSYGKNTGGFDLIQALATLAWEGRRSEFFKTELVQALLILQNGHITREDFKGSWAGAMGQNQFMPSSWNKFAVDFNGDGHKDIWTTKADIFASTANYLHQNGWNQSLKWGWPVVYQPAFKDMVGTPAKSYQHWLALGVKFKGHLPSIPAETPLKLIVPDGGDGRAYLVTQNFDVIKTWNKSNYFALTVGLLSDLIAQNKSVSVIRDDTPDSHLNH